jgi:phosphoribosylformylglycinamidine (FGAM) synthase-like amidotransferase family enzyme
MHKNDLIDNQGSIDEYQILVIGGGFSLAMTTAQA